MSCYCCGLCCSQDDATKDDTMEEYLSDIPKKSSGWCVDDSASERVFIPDGKRDVFLCVEPKQRTDRQSIFRTNSRKLRTTDSCHVMPPYGIVAVGISALWLFNTGYAIGINTTTKYVFQLAKPVRQTFVAPPFPLPCLLRVLTQNHGRSN